MRANVIPPALPGAVATGTGEEKFVKPTKHKITLKNLRSLSWLLSKPTVPLWLHWSNPHLKTIVSGPETGLDGQGQAGTRENESPKQVCRPQPGLPVPSTAFPRALSTQPSTLHGCHLPSAVESYFCIYSFFQKLNNFYSTSACALGFCII